MIMMTETMTKGMMMMMKKMMETTMMIIMVGDGTGMEGGVGVRSMDGERSEFEEAQRGNSKVWSKSMWSWVIVMKRMRVLAWAVS